LTIPQKPVEMYSSYLNANLSQKEGQQNIKMGSASDIQSNTMLHFKRKA